MKKIFEILTGLLLLGILSVGAWLSISKIFELLNNIDKQLAVTIISASSTIIISVISVLYAKYLENKRMIKMEIRDKKIPIYDDFINYFFKFMYSKEENRQQELENYFRDLSPKLIIWGSDEVIREWNSFKNIANENNAYNTALHLEKILFAIRKI